MLLPDEAIDTLIDVDLAEQIAHLRDARGGTLRVMEVSDLYFSKLYYEDVEDPKCAMLKANPSAFPPPPARGSFARDAA
jgi:hypothetical protein